MVAPRSLDAYPPEYIGQMAAIEADYLMASGPQHAAFWAMLDGAPENPLLHIFTGMAAGNLASRVPFAMHFAVTGEFDPPQTNPRYDREVVNLFIGVGPVLSSTVIAPLHDEAMRWVEPVKRLYDPAYGHKTLRRSVVSITPVRWRLSPAVGWLIENTRIYGIEFTLNILAQRYQRAIPGL